MRSYRVEKARRDQGGHPASHVVPTVKDDENQKT